MVFVDVSDISIYHYILLIIFLSSFVLYIGYRCGRLGTCFVTISAVCIWQGARIFLPDRQSKRAREIEIKRDSRAEKEHVCLQSLTEVRFT